MLKPQAEWRQQDVTERGKSLDERGKRHSYLELGMRRSGSPILENYRSTKREKKKKVVQAKKRSRGAPVLDLAVP